MTKEELLRLAKEIEDKAMPASESAIMVKEFAERTEDEGCSHFVEGSCDLPGFCQIEM